MIFRVSPNDLRFDEFDYDWIKKVENDFNERGIMGFNWMNLKCGDCGGKYEVN